MIDRVVNAIAAGRDTPLLCSAEDLAAFKAELTYLLVHQKMSFNSPVWFQCRRRRATAMLSMFP